MKWFTRFLDVLTGVTPEIAAARDSALAEIRANPQVPPERLARMLAEMDTEHHKWM